MITVLALVGSHLTALRKSVTYDVLMRLPMLAWAMGLAITLLTEFQQYRDTASPKTHDLAYVLNV